MEQAITIKHIETTIPIVIVWAALAQTVAMRIVIRVWLILVRAALAQTMAIQTEVKVWLIPVRVALAQTMANEIVIGKA